MALKEFVVESLSATAANNIAAAFDEVTLVVAVELLAGSSAEERAAFCKAVDEATDYELRFDIVGDVVRFSRKLQR